MQFRRLEFSALGPFPGKHLINFDELMASGLFLFDGPTGAGKSSIIDAIVFALYGKVAGDESDDSRIRSAYADDRTESYADLIFTLPSGIYRVRRSPAWQRKKKRGEGTTPVASTANLWRLSEAVLGDDDPAGEHIASGARDVGEALSPLLSLTRKQFVQTIVLPQGQFAQFLRLSSTERSALLETLFDTEDYRTFALELKKAADAAQADVTAAQAEAERALHAWCDIDGLAEKFDVENLAFTDVDDDTPLTFIAKADAELAGQSAAAKTLATKAKQTYDSAVQKRQKAEELRRALTDLATLKARRDELSAQADNISELRERVALHHKVATAVDRLDSADAARAALESATTGLPDGAGDLVAAIEAGNVDRLAVLADELVTTTGTEIGKLTKKAGALDAVVVLEEGLERRRAELAALTTDADKLGQDIAKLNRELEAFPEQLAVLDKQVAAARADGETAPAREAELNTLQALRTQLENLARVSDQVAKARERHERADSQHREQLVRVRALTDLWRESTAANLAEELVENEPCPVCGSVSHPHPATPGAESATLADVQAAEEALAPLAKELEVAANDHAKLKGNEEELRNVTGSAELADVDQQIDTASQQLASAQAAKKLETKLLGQRVERERAHQQREKQLAQLQQDLRALNERNAIAAKSLADDSAAVAQARGSHESVAALRADLLAKESELSELRARGQLIGERARAYDTARVQAHEALDAAGLDAGQARAGFLAAEALAQAEAAISEHDKAVAAVQAQLADKRFADVTGTEEPDVAGAQQAEIEADREYQEAQRAHTLAENRSSASARLRKKITKEHNTWKQAVANAGPALRLSSIANAESQSLSKIRLSTWVLLRRFEQIVDRANEHLREFSFGRYELARTDDADGERKTGLGLEIIHHDSGPRGDHRRGIGTLSGGETFYTSLALALALSEVVQAENGGIRMETLIIDEGFGSLSSEYLQSIMDTLGKLRKGGRTVGIVSHVDELKSMISDRVSVRPLPDGGSTLAVIAGN
ncbi:AAA family ATPase [Trueperella bialowiezensis]|uniref:Nuclease SbcCD subunit C n=1 Tax=Trueperella bialowiezensis TaxID=312285 RepID=A0A3S4V7I1_9ACTO|nr:SMC family ATPase [Trueperella bialowiezensis]VEI13721.1 Nuclease sbcCD subunit C [Trueperella bialowiezensis]